MQKKLENNTQADEQDRFSKIAEILVSQWFFAEDDVREPTPSSYEILLSKINKDLLPEELENSTEMKP